MHAEPTQVHTGPYVITTTRFAHGAFRRNIIERRAVATLDEARRCVTRGISDSGRKAGSTDYASAAAMGDGGCDLGPLPDGRMIKVERKDQYFLADVVPHNRHMSQAELIDAYNAMQGARSDG